MHFFCWSRTTKNRLKLGQMTGEVTCAKNDGQMREALRHGWN